MHLLALFIAALVVSSVLTHYVRNMAIKHGWTCAGRPRNRDVHAGHIPRLGGVAIILSFTLVIVIYTFFARMRWQAIGLGVYTSLAILGPALLMFVLGLVDDLRSVAPKVKLAVQVVAALLLFYGGVRIYFVPLLSGYRELNGIVSLLLTVLWVLLISNAFNLIDGLDGLSAGSALFSTGVVFIASLLSGVPLVSVMTVVLAGAILGFLRFNFNPATIFLGDCGSLFLGFMLSAVSLAGAQKSTTVVAVAIPIVSFGLPLLDTMLAVVRRFLSGQPLFTADREHIHHRLMKRGFTHKQTVVMLYGVCACFGFACLLLLYPQGSSTGIVLAVVGVGVWVGVQHLGYPALAEIGCAARRTVPQKQIIVNNLAVRLATEELSSARDFSDICSALRAGFEANEFDGFDLSFRPKSAQEPLISTVLRRSYSGAYSFEWRRTDRPLGGTAYWQLGMALQGSQIQQASFTVYRAESQRNLLFDINVLTGNFQKVLGTAIDRALSETPTEEPRYVAAAFAAAERSM